MREMGLDPEEEEEEEDPEGVDDCDPAKMRMAVCSNDKRVSDSAWDELDRDDGGGGVRGGAEALPLKPPTPLSFSFCILRTFAYLSPHALQSVFGPRGPRRHSGVSVAKHSRQRRSEFGFFFRCFFASYAVKSGSFPWNFTSVTPPPSFPTDGMMLGRVVVVRMVDDSMWDVDNDFGDADGG